MSINLLNQSEIQLEINADLKKCSLRDTQHNILNLFIFSDILHVQMVTALKKSYDVIIIMIVRINQMNIIVTKLANVCQINLCVKTGNVFLILLFVMKVLIVKTNLMNLLIIVQQELV